MAHADYVLAVVAVSDIQARLWGTNGYLLYRVGLDGAQLVDGRRGNPPYCTGNNTAD